MISLSSRGSVDSGTLFLSALMGPEFDTFLAEHCLLR